ncbi:MAG: hypothetical protein ABUL72_06035, partial [Armatimonadota bacterium]
ALPFGRDWCADGPYADRLISRYPTVRTGRFGVNSLVTAPTEGLLTIPCRILKGSQIIDSVRDAIKHPAWLILSIGEIGESGLSKEDHSELLKYLGASRDVLDVAPVVQIVGRKRIALPSGAHLS